MIRLVQEFGAHTGRQLSFSQPRIRLGRAPSNEVAFDPNVDLDSSGTHCELVLENGVWYAVDQNSRNGTWVNGVRVNRQRLSSNDVIECGRGGPRLRIEIALSQPAALSNPAAGMSAFQAGNAQTEAIPAMAAPTGFPQGTFGSNPTSQNAVSPFSTSTPPSGTGFNAPLPMQPAIVTAPSQRPPGFAPIASPAPAQSAPAGFAPMGNSPSFNPLGAQSSGGGSIPAPPFHQPSHPQPGPTGAPPGFGAPIPGASPFMPHAQHAPTPHSPGAAVAANLPAGAQVGKRTVAMLIDQALVQAGVKKSSSTGMKVAIGATLVLVIAGLAVGGWFIWDQKQDTDERLAQVQQGGGGGEGSAGQRITRANESAIYMLAAVSPGGMPQGFCTGFAVTQDLLATNAHCVDVANEMITQRGRSIVALRNNGRGIQIPVQPIFRDPRFRNTAMGIEGSGYDVGVMRAAMPLPLQVRLASYQESTQLTPGAQIYVYGFPGLTMNEVSPVATITEGILNRMTDFFDRAADDPSLAQKIQHSAQTTSGSSGSPIFLASGEVIGINAGSLSDAEHQSMVDPQTGRRVSVEVSRSSNFKYGMRSDLIRAAVQAVGENAP